MIPPFIRPSDDGKAIELCLVEVLDPMTGSTKLHVRAISADLALQLAEGLLREANRLLADNRERKHRCALMAKDQPQLG